MMLTRQSAQRRPGLTLELVQPAETAARLLFRLIEEQLKAEPTRGTLAAKARGRLHLVYTDKGETISLSFAGDGRLTVASGFVGLPDASVLGPGQAVLRLCHLPGRGSEVVSAIRAPERRRNLMRTLRESPVHVHAPLHSYRLLLALQRLISVYRA